MSGRIVIQAEEPHRCAVASSRTTIDAPMGSVWACDVCHRTWVRRERPMPRASQYSLAPYWRRESPVRRLWRRLKGRAA